ncbi:MAG: tetratricopeptide repeat protein [Candidatus Marinimicrobia bacterium]|nr:tetratricopeptide repeat protein [Candidatus Neomarinimicrobiota bacterium]
MDNDNNEKLRMLARILEKQGKYDEAVDAYSKLQMFDKAIECFEKVTSENQQSRLIPELGLNLINKLIIEKVNDSEKVRRFFTDCMKIKDIDIKLLSARSLLFWGIHQNNPKALIEIIKEMIQIFDKSHDSGNSATNDVDILYFLGFLKVGLFNNSHNLKLFDEISESVNSYIKVTQKPFSNLFMSKLILLFSMEHGNIIIESLELEAFTDEASKWFDELQKKYGELDYDREKNDFSKLKEELILKLTYNDKRDRPFGNYDEIESYLLQTSLFLLEFIGLQIVLNQSEKTAMLLTELEGMLRISDEKFINKNYGESFQLLKTIINSISFKLLGFEEQRRIFLSIAKCAFKIGDDEEFESIWDQMDIKGMVRDIELLSEIDNPKNW